MAHQTDTELNKWPNWRKPVIRHIREVDLFTADGDFITDAKAREVWDAGTGDWSRGASQEMNRRITDLTHTDTP